MSRLLENKIKNCHIDNIDEIYNEIINNKKINKQSLCFSIYLLAEKCIKYDKLKKAELFYNDILKEYNMNLNIADLYYDYGYKSKYVYYIFNGLLTGTENAYFEYNSNGTIRLLDFIEDKLYECNKLSRYDDVYKLLMKYRYTCYISSDLVIANYLYNYPFFFFQLFKSYYYPNYRKPINSGDIYVMLLFIKN